MQRAGVRLGERHKQFTAVDVRAPVSKVSFSPSNLFSTSNLKLNAGRRPSAGAELVGVCAPGCELKLGRMAGGAALVLALSVGAWGQGVSAKGGASAATKVASATNSRAASATPSIIDSNTNAMASAANAPGADTAIETAAAKGAVTAATSGAANAANAAAAASSNAGPANPFTTPWAMSAHTASAAPAAMIPAKTVETMSARVPSMVWQMTAVEPSLPGTPVGGGTSDRLERVRKIVSGKYDVGHIGDRGIGKGVNFYSLDKEIMMGKELSEEVEKHAKLFTDPQVNEYVNRLAQNLVRNSDAKVPFTVKIIDSDEVNAFALPGGFFYINTGLIMAADNEAELAGVMAHEIGHVAARHATKMATKKEIWDLASIPLIFVGGPAGMAVRQFIGVAVPMSFLKFSRNAEREADLLGIEYQYAAGYDPAAFVNFFEKLSSKEKKKANIISKAFSTHPMTEDRMKRSQEVMETMLPANEQYLVTTSDFENVKERLARMTTGRRLEDVHPDKPTLRKASAATASSGSEGPVVR